MKSEDITAITNALRDALVKPLEQQLREHVENEVARRIHNLSTDAASDEIRLILQKAVKRFVRVSVEVTER